MFTLIIALTPSSVIIPHYYRLNGKNLLKLYKFFLLTIQPKTKHAHTHAHTLFTTCTHIYTFMSEDNKLKRNAEKIDFYAHHINWFHLTCLVVYCSTG